MDRQDVDPAALRGALRHVEQVNRWLGGRRALLHHLEWGLEAGGRLLDVGTGSADLPVAVADHASSRGRSVSITCVDSHPSTASVARERVRGRDDIRVLCGDGLHLPFPDGAFDLALLSMTLHHMDGPALTGILSELGRVARGGRILVGELERSLPHYLGARVLAATIWRSNPVTRHDGPISVLRGFSPTELVDLAQRAELRHPQVHRHPVYRLVLRAEA